MKVVYDPRHFELLPGNSTLNFTISTVADSLSVDYSTVFDELPTEPFYFLLDINYVADKQGPGEITIVTEHSESIKALQQFLIPDQVISRVVCGSAMILLSRPYHGFPIEVLDKLVAMITDLHSHIAPLQRSQFVFMLPAAGKKFVPYLNIIDFTFFERMVGERRHEDNKNRIWQHRVKVIDSYEAPRHRFVCTNRRSNVFRMACTTSLWDLRDRGILTLLQSPDELSGEFDQEPMLQNYFPELYEKFVSEIKPQLPLIWDVGFGLELSATECIAPDHDDFLSAMLDSALCIVNETLMADQPPQWHSEKTYKAISLMMPFIIVGQRHSLRTLRDQGYKTFDPWINESYDSIADPKDRLRASMAEARRIIEMSDGDIATLLRDIQPVLVHNFRHFHKRYDNFDYDAVDKLQAILDKWTVAFSQ